MSAHHTYQLHFRLKQPITLQVGSLGEFHFPAGEYLYTGSAKRNMQARLERHQRKDKPLRWHIDYLTSLETVEIHRITTSNQPECQLNQAQQGDIVVKGFGASDCRHGCGSHLLYLGVKKGRITDPSSTEGEKL